MHPDDNSGLESDLDKNEEATYIYSSYIGEIISAFVLFSQPSLNVEVISPVVKDSATKIIQMTKFFIEVNKEISKNTIILKGKW